MNGHLLSKFSAAILTLVIAHPAFCGESQGAGDIGSGLTAQTNTPAQPRRLGRSPVETFRMLLAMQPEERMSHLQMYPPGLHERMIAKLQEYQALPEELREIEREVNDIILANYPVKAEEKSLSQAREEGAMALFGEKYGDTVRTITIVSNGTRYSYELCGGVHVGETAEIGQMVITSEGSVSAGIRRIEALTGRGAQAYIQENLDRLDYIAQKLGTTPEHTPERLNALQDELANSKKEIASLRREIARSNFNQLIDNMDRVNGVPVLIAQVTDINMDTMREMSDWFRNKIDSGVLVLGTVVEDRPQLLVAVSDDLTKKGLHAGNLIKGIASKVGGGGGGRPNLAQAGGRDASQLSAALHHASELISDSYQPE